MEARSYIVYCRSILLAFLSARGSYSVLQMSPASAVETRCMQSGLGQHLLDGIWPTSLRNPANARVALRILLQEQMLLHVHVTMQPLQADTGTSADAIVGRVVWAWVVAARCADGQAEPHH